MHSTHSAQHLDHKALVCLVARVSKRRIGKHRAVVEADTCSCHIRRHVGCIAGWVVLVVAARARGCPKRSKANARDHSLQEEAATASNQSNIGIGTLNADISVALRLAIVHSADGVA